MKPLLTTFDKRILNRIQQELPIVPRPYQRIADELGCTEQDVISRLQWLKDQGFIRRMGTFFNSAGFGYISTLIAVQVEPDFIERVACKINAYPGVTHNYEREGAYNLWFTLFTKTGEEQQQIITEVRQLPGVCDVMNLPASQKFKVNVKFTVE